MNGAAPRDALVADVTPQELRGAAFGLRQSLDTVGAFPGPRGKPLSNVAVSKLCGELSGERCVPHGWRSTFRD